MRQFLFPSVTHSLFSLSTLLLAFTLSWCVLSQANFLYPIWHDVGGIGKGIDKYGPKNKFKPGFGDTTKAERSQLFSEINTAVHNDGDGLESIEYETTSSKGRQTLLRQDEILHLQDVANLIGVLTLSSIVNVLIWLFFATYFICVLKALPSIRSQITGLAVVIVLCSLALFAAGPVKVFNQFHIWIFPEEHKWFFYYQESLMSTLMLAPKLFGWIAAALVSLSILFFGLLCFLSSYTAQFAIRLLQRKG